MSSSDIRRGNWGPQAKAGAVSFTFDNFGEAAEVEMGLWPAETPVGSHYTVREVVPELIRTLDRPATFFIEGWNTEVYPKEIAALAASGHEIGMHAWRHEHWKVLSEEKQAEAFKLAHAGFRSLNIDVQGFRPPGGIGSALLDQLILDHGMSYVSDVGFGATFKGDTIHLPFAWAGVDGVYLEPDLGKAVGVGGADETGLPALIRSYKGAMDRAAQTGDHVVFIFHCFLLGQDAARMEALHELIAYADQRGDLWLASCCDVARWMMRDRESASDINLAN